MKGSPSQCKLSQHCQMWLEQSVFPVHLRSRSGIVAPQTLAALSPLIARRLADIQGKAFVFLCCPASLGASLLTVTWYSCSALLRHEGCHCGGGGLVSVGALFLWTVEAFQFVLACDPAPFLPKLTSLIVSNHFIACSFWKREHNYSYMQKCEVMTLMSYLGRDLNEPPLRSVICVSTTRFPVDKTQILIWQYLNFLFLSCLKFFLCEIDTEGISFFFTY